jgi:hypothetical protein
MHVAAGRVMEDGAQEVGGAVAHRALVRTS